MFLNSAKKNNIEWVVDFGILAEISPRVAHEHISAQPWYPLMTSEDRIQMWSSALAMTLGFMSPSACDAFAAYLSEHVSADEFRAISELMIEKCERIRQDLLEMLGE